VHVDCAFVDLGRASPHQIEELRSREHPPRLFEQMFEHLKLGRAEVDVAIAVPNASAQSI
jgi:hypothetical protein